MKNPAAVHLVFAGGSRVSSFDPAGLELAWNDKIICQTSRGHDFGRVVKANHALEKPPSSPLRRVVRRATDVDYEKVEENRPEEKRAMLVFRELLRRDRLDVEPVSVEIVFDGSRAVVSYEATKRRDLSALQPELEKRLGRRVELRAVGPRECARLCGDYGLCGTKHCCRRFPSHEKPITLRMAKDQDVSMSSGRITGLCGRLRCCLAYEHPLYKSFRDRAPRVGRRVQTPKGVGVVTGYTVLADTCTVELEGAASAVDVPIDECREVARGGRRESR